MIETAAGVSIAVWTVGRGKPVLMIPSLGRGAADFQEIAAAMAAKGWMAILADPRGTGGSKAPVPKDLYDLAGDAAKIVETLCTGPVDVVGHAFGNRIARAMATAHPTRVSQVALLAGGGEVAPTPEIVTALEGSFAQGSKPDHLRRHDLQKAFFAAGNDPSVWLQGWYPAAAQNQIAATTATPVKSWWQAGNAPLLLVHAMEDALAPVGNAKALQRDVGARLTLVWLNHAGHAMLPEQPNALASVLMAYFSGERQVARLQKRVDKATRRPPAS